MRRCVDGWWSETHASATSGMLSIRLIHFDLFFHSYVLSSSHITSLEEEVAAKTKRMKTVFAMLQAAQAEIEEVQRERQEHNAEMINYIKEASRELRRNLLVIQEFIPPEYIRQIEQESTWDETTGEWSIPAISATGNSLRKAEFVEAGASGVITDADRGDGGIAAASRQAFQLDLEKQCVHPNFISHIV